MPLLRTRFPRRRVAALGAHNGEKYMAKQQMVSETRGIGQLLNERRYFEVPPHQRDFAWPLGL